MALSPTPLPIPLVSSLSGSVWSSYRKSCVDMVMKWLVPESSGRYVNRMTNEALHKGNASPEFWTTRGPWAALQGIMGTTGWPVLAWWSTASQTGLQCFLCLPLIRESACFTRPALGMFYGVYKMVKCMSCFETRDLIHAFSLLLEPMPYFPLHLPFGDCFQQNFVGHHFCCVDF